ncbi:MAG: nitrilase-related carbon-nitrogen hydrolase [Acidimicrobiales bacterium]
MHDEPHHRADAVVDELVDDLVHPPDELPGPIERFVHRPWVRAVVAGICLAASLPPWGFWPLAFVGVALLDRLLAGAAWRSRLWRGTLVGWTLFFPTILWISQLTAPGYVIASLFFGFLIGAACLLVPPHAGRGLALIGAWVLVESLRTAWPFGGVPLSLLAVGQVAGVLWPIARVGGVLGIAAATVAVGVAVSAAFDRHHTKAAAFAGFAIVLLGVAAVAPSGEPTGRTVDIALVQGGGPQGTRAIDTDRRKVFERHLDASAEVPEGMDMVLWPENVVDTDADVQDAREGRELQALARRLDAPLSVGTVEGVDEESFRNSQQVLDADGEWTDRYVKVQRAHSASGCRSGRGSRRWRPTRSPSATPPSRTSRGCSPSATSRWPRSSAGRCSSATGPVRAWRPAASCSTTPPTVRPTRARSCRPSRWRRRGCGPSSRAGGSCRSLSPASAPT